MPYLAVGDFKYGMDRRRPQTVGIPGTLWVLKNAVVSRGGDIERCKKWVLTHTLPANSASPNNFTKGLAVRNNQLAVFAWPWDTATTFPYDVSVVRLTNPNGSAASEVLERAIGKPFDNKLYSIAEFADGYVEHFYDGTRVSDWDDIAATLISKNTLAQRIAIVVGRNDDVEVVAQEDRVIFKALVPGTPFTLGYSTSGGSAPVAATTTITFTAVTGATIVSRIAATNGVTTYELIDTGSPITGQANPTAMATAVRSAINARAGTTGFSAAGSGADVDLTAPAGALYNGWGVGVAIASGTIAGVPNFSGGADSTATGSITQTAVQANVVAVDEVRSTGTVTITGGGPGGQITSLTVDGVELLDAPVNWLTDAAATANALVVAINNAANTTLLASAVGAVVTLTAAEGTGTSPNGDVVDVTSSIITTSEANMAGGVAAVEAQRQIEYLTVATVGGVGPFTTFTITLDGVAYNVYTAAAGKGTSIFVQKNRVWSTAGSTVQYCKLNDPSDWDDVAASSGSGFINIGNVADGAQYLYGIGDYQGKAAIFAENVVVLYQFFADAQQIAIQQPINNVGTRSIAAVTSYGADDVFFLDKTGIRSLRSRDGYDAAFASDIGSAIDPFVKDVMREVTRSDVFDAQSVVETDDGRFMMAIGRYIIILSYFPASKITAWSYIDFEQDIEAIVRCGDRIVLRSGNNLYTYGGEDGLTYPDDDEFEVVVETPFMTASDAATKKQLLGYDHVAVNEWRVETLVDPNDTSKTVEIGRLVGTTNNDLAATLVGYTTHFALRYTCDRAGFASLSAIATHFVKGEKT